MLIMIIISIFNIFLCSILYYAFNVVYVNTNKNPDKFLFLNLIEPDQKELNQLKANYKVSLNLYFIGIVILLFTFVLLYYFFNNTFLMFGWTFAFLITTFGYFVINAKYIRLVKYDFNVVDDNYAKIKLGGLYYNNPLDSESMIYWNDLSSILNLSTRFAKVFMGITCGIVIVLIAISVIVAILN